MHKKAISILVLGILSGNSFAQQAPTSSGSSNEERIVINKSDGQRPGDTPNQTANPYGSINTKTGNDGINYGQSSITNSSLPVPNTTATQQGVGYAVSPMAPDAPPAGLPNDYNQEPEYGMGAQRMDDQTSAALGILNADPKRIKEINRTLFDRGRVLNEFPVTPPKSVNGVLTASLSPGSTPPLIRLSKNRTTSIIITDANGQPWPILNYDGLSSEDFTVRRLDAPAPNGYVLSVTPRGTFVSGNLTLMLDKLASPLSIDFVSAQKEVDARTEIRVQAMGPKTKFSSIGMPNAIDTSLLSVLQGVPPMGAKPLKSSSDAVQAWLSSENKMYVRTRYKIMSPAFENVSSSPDGTYAYKLSPVPVVLYKVDNGRFGEFNIDGF